MAGSSSNVVLEVPKAGLSEVTDAVPRKGFCAENVAPTGSPVQLRLESSVTLRATLAARGDTTDLLCAPPSLERVDSSPHLRPSASHRLATYTMWPFRQESLVQGSELRATELRQRGALYQYCLKQLAWGRSVSPCGADCYRCNANTLAPDGKSRQQHVRRDSRATQVFPPPLIVDRRSHLEAALFLSDCCVADGQAKSHFHSLLLLERLAATFQAKVRMKFFAPVVVAVVAFFSVQVDANGVCYDPDHTSGKSASTVQSDMETIAGAGFSSVRTYISKFGNTDMGPIITGAGLTAVLGVPYPQSDYQEQMEAAISAANSGGVAVIMVGNENLAGVSSVPSDMISVIQQIKARVSCKVGTVQRNTEVINYQSISGWSDLVSAVDVLGVNVHPFFNYGTTADGAIDVVDKQWQTMMSSFGDKLMLTETGWPSSGSSSGNTGSLSGEQTFYSAYQQWSSSLSEKFYFQFFDTPSKSELYEQTFGLYTSDSQPKFTMSQQQQTTTSAPTTEAPAPTTAAATPEPTTATPTPTTTAPEPTTATPTPTPETYQSTGSSETNTTSSVASASASGSDSSVQQGLASFSGSDNSVQVSSSSKDSSTKQDSTTGSNSEKSTQTTQTSQSTATNSIGKSSETQQQTSSKGNDSTQEANTQSEGGSSGGVVGFAVAGGACAMLVAFGFIYQTRKRAQELEEEDKDQRFSVITPTENICAL
ncbi:hypothetical protein PRNP1_006444 [Phytophthora ramorum]